LNDNVHLDGGSSYDDVGIVNYSWDLDNDGVYEMFGSEVEAVFDTLGNHTVNLRVEDAWGNFGTDTFLIDVRSPEEGTEPHADDGWGGLALMTVVIIGILVPATFFLRGNRRQKDIRKRFE
jgi:hypothetical protein